MQGGGAGKSRVPLSPVPNNRRLFLNNPRLFPNNARLFSDKAGLLEEREKVLGYRCIHKTTEASDDF